MSRLDDKTLALLGGYAAGTLSAEEQRWLAEAALRDQAVFDAMADEEALRELLSDQAAKARLAALLQPAGERWWRKPWAWAAMAAPVLAGLALLVMLPDESKERQLMAKAGPQPAVLTSREVVRPQLAPPELAQPAEAAVPAPARSREPATEPAAAPVAPPAAPGLQEEKRTAAAEGALAVATVSAPESAPGANEAARQIAPRLETRVSAPAALADAAAAAPAQAEADAIGRLTPKKEAAAPGVLTVQVLARLSPAQEWTPLEADTLPAGTQLRLLIRTSQPGMLRVLPGTGNLITLNRPADSLPIDLDAQPAGRFDLNVTFFPGRPAAARALSAAGGRAMQSTLSQEQTTAPVSFSRRLTVR